MSDPKIVDPRQISFKWPEPAPADAYAIDTQGPKLKWVNKEEYEASRPESRLKKAEGLFSDIVVAAEAVLDRQWNYGADCFVCHAYIREKDSEHTQGCPVGVLRRAIARTKA